MSGGEFVAGDKKFHSCGNRTTLDIDTESDDTYLLLATTVGELETKHRPLQMLKSRFNEFLKFITSCVPSGIVGRSPSRIFKSKAFSKQNEKRINRILSFADSDTSQVM
ncbi:hypothetical protein RhiirA4_459804 [Rhizophagus irregularis]|uniref:Uncharacterized protein n=1 Tax=Rhizophagus irregularis TaxID=588596 RepID=A0A2I1GF79_9GLOM|nr:hypothetical protein RhiirA4_459804 [Rhizophagus irregularis]